LSRTGLTIALAIAVVTGIAFGIYPEWDLRFSALFFDVDKREFTLRWSSLFGAMRELAMWLVAALIVPSLIALVVKFWMPQTRLLVSGRVIVFLTATLLLAPGLVANAVMKDNWGRVRPSDVKQFAGSKQFTPWWDPRDSCPRNCSFVAGEGAAAFWTIAPAALAPAPWRPLAYAAALGFGAAVSGLRVVFGAHFLSDGLFAGVFTFLVIWLVHGLIYRWPSTRVSDRALERVLERAIQPLHANLQALLVRRPRSSDP
jgi:membrane-associated PAP2 superfamily phosphatase